LHTLHVIISKQEICPRFSAVSSYMGIPCCKNAKQIGQMGKTNTGGKSHQCACRNSEVNRVLTKPAPYRKTIHQPCRHNL